MEVEGEIREEEDAAIFREDRRQCQGAQGGPIQAGQPQPSSIGRRSRSYFALRMRTVPVLVK